MKYSDFIQKAVSSLVANIHEDKDMNQEAKRFYIDELLPLSKAETFADIESFNKEYEARIEVIKAKFKETKKRDEKENWTIISAYHVRYIYELAKIAAGYTTASAQLANIYTKILGKETIDMKIVEVTDEQLAKMDKTVL